MKLGHYQWRLLLNALLISLLPIPVALAAWWLLDRQTQLPNDTNILLAIAVALATVLVLALTIYASTSRALRIIYEHLSAIAARNFSHRTTRRLTGGFGALVPMLNKVSDQLEELSTSSESQTSVVSAEAGRLRNVINSITDGVVALDKNAHIILFNKAAAKITGFSFEEAAGKAASQILPLLRGNTLIINDWLETVAGADIQAKRFEGVRLKTKDGKTRAIDAETLYQGADPNGIRTLITFHDRTEEQEVEDMKLDFVALAAHELRTPITVIRGYIEILESELGDKLGEEHREFMRKLSISASQLSGFINNILHVSRIEHGDLNFKLEPADWVSLIKNVCHELAQKASVQGKALKLNLPDELPEVGVDRMSIVEVITNLIDNAIKYSDRGTKITVAVRQEGETIETAITDQGAGIPENAIDKLFTKFYRSHRTRDSHRGTGLGLYMSKSIVEAHGGSIWVRSQPGEGSTFGFSLPIYAKMGYRPKTDESKKIIRGVHGWIKNHSLYRG